MTCRTTFENRGGVEWLIIHVPGGDTVEYILTDADGKAVRPDKIEQYQLEYDAWKNGGKAPLRGTNIRQCDALTPEQIRTCERAHVLTVEDLAQASEQTIRTLGMGAREIKNKAVQWLSSHNSTGALFAENERLNTMLAESNEQIAALQQQLMALAEKVNGKDDKPKAEPLKLKSKA